MSLLIETICLKDGEFRNLTYHEQRMQRALKLVYESNTKPRIEDYLKNTPFPELGFYKCRITYNDQFKKAEFINYEIRPITSLKCIVNDSISYEHKFEDRHELNALFAQKQNCDDILIIKSGLITDASYANIVFREGDHWVTPTSFLLQGTMRSSLLDRKLITEQVIRVQDLQRFTKFKLINAMLGFEGPEIDVSNIVH
jgi:4-amino-4-deoxychorismate lyase